MTTYTRADGLALRVTPLDHGIVHLSWGGLDGFEESLLQRYGLLEKLPPAEGVATAADGSLRLPSGHVLRADPELGLRVERAGETVFATAPGFAPGTAPTRARNRGWRLPLALRPGEKLLGFGDQHRRGLLLNGQRGSLWIRNQRSYIPVPFFMSNRGYGVLLNTTRRVHFDLGASDPAAGWLHVEQEYCDLFLFLGDDYDTLIERYTALAGRPQLPPRYSFGLWLVMNEKADAHAVLSIARELRQARIPADLISLEPGWMEKYYDYSLKKSWHPERFSFAPWTPNNPSSFINNLRSMGYHVGLWLCCDYDFTWEEERRLAAALAPAAAPHSAAPAEPDPFAGLELVEEDPHIGHHPIRFDRHTTPEEPWFAHLRAFADQGAEMFKLDGASTVNEHPDRLYGNGRRDDELHNLNFTLYAKQMVEGYAAHTGKRGLVLSVAGWAGFQRYPGTWTGDTGGGTQPLCAMLQESFVGHAFTTCDMNVDEPGGIHLGFLLPWAQINSWAYYRYPLYKGDFTEGVFRAYAELRSRLLPFYYSLAQAATRSGRAILRPMPLAYPDAEPAYACSKQFLLGDAFLVSAYAPEVVVPPGRWLDLWHETWVDGDWTAQALPWPKDRGGHLLLAPGALVPRGPLRQFTDEPAPEELSWLVYPTDRETRFTLYLDDGLTLAHRGGAYARAELICTPAPAGGWTLHWGAIEGTEPWRLERLRHSFEIVLPGADGAVKKEIHSPKAHGETLRVSGL